MIITLLLTFCYSWNQQVHIIATEIAFRRVGDSPHTSIRSVLQMNDEKVERDSIVGAWISSVELPPINTKTFNHWRFVKNPINRGDNEVDKHSNEDDLVTEVTQLNNALTKNTITDLWSYTLAFKSFFGLYIDLFSPLHNAELFNFKDQNTGQVLFPDGDDSGQKFFINYDDNNISLYDFWESGCGRFKEYLPYNNTQWQNIDRIVDELRASVPSNTSIPSDIKKISQESLNIANTSVYSISINQNIVKGDEYYNKCIQITNERIVIGAYSLSNILKKIHVPSFPQKMPEQLIGQSEILAWGVLALLLPALAFLVWNFFQLKVKTE